MCYVANCFTALSSSKQTKPINTITESKCERQVTFLGGGYTVNIIKINFKGVIIGCFINSILF